jgi:hypothetical protein
MIASKIDAIGLQCRRDTGPGQLADVALGAGEPTAGPGQLADVALGAGALTAGPGKQVGAALGAAAATAGPGQLAAAALGASMFSMNLVLSKRGMSSFASTVASSLLP